MSWASQSNAPFGVSVANEKIKGFQGVSKFGFNLAVAATEETIWSAGGDITYITTAGVASAASTDSDDNGGTVRVYGLDANYDLIDETITIGSGTSTKTFWRVYRVVLVTAGTGTTNAGNITVTVDSKTAGHIPAGYGQSLQCNYTVPRGHTAYMVQVDLGVDEKDKPVYAVIKTRDNTITGAAFQSKIYMVIESNWVSQPVMAPVVIPEKTDIELRAKGTASAVAVSGGFELFLKRYISDT